MDWKNAKHIEQNEYDIPANWLHIHYFNAYNILFRIENALRLLVYIVLKTHYHDKWAEKKIVQKNNSNVSINKLSEKIIDRSKGFDYLRFAQSNPLFYLTFENLYKIIT